ncbi:MAG: DNA recombination protein RmuC [Rickettsiales bacterium]|jgi:DNA recombination protein RmuC|nr:DNA recombination protein RmuC [Rickettsiales bacterium]
MEIVVALAAFFAGFFIAWLAKPNALKESAARAADENRKLRDENVRLATLNQTLPQQLELLSAKILKSHAAESREIVLAPFAAEMQKIKSDFDKKILDMEKGVAVVGAAAGSLTKEAADFARAFRQSRKLQGNWGENILENIFRLLGFTQGREYETQVNVKGIDGANYFLDFVLNLPNDRKVIIDSKASLESYIKYENATDAIEKDGHLAELVRATRDHIRGLGAKEYQKKLKDYNLDFVFMFVPREEIYFAIIEKAPEIIDESMKNNVAIITPSLLYPMMRTIDNLLKIDRQNKNIGEVVAMVNSLWEKYAGFTESFAEVGRRLDGASAAYGESMKRLSTGAGNMAGWIEKIKKKSGIASNKMAAIEGED